MEKFEIRPYKIIGKVQYYDWGTKNNDALIPKLLGIQPEQDKPYAELWFGTHPNAPSDVVLLNGNISLIEFISNYPNEILGERVNKKFSSKLPFLLKVLSINQALSIQSHPDKELAKILHQKDPVNYPDDNHKPEIAIAIDSLTALVGIKPKEAFKQSLKEYPEIKMVLSEETIDVFEQSIFSDSVLKKIYTDIMFADSDSLEKCIEELKSRFENKSELTENEKQFLIQYNYYKADVGLISILLYNIIKLKENEAIFTPAGIPHAYIKGNIVECMANSDNVVRAGLTSKYKDVDTLLNMLELDNSQSIVDIYEKENKIIYKTGAEEFEISKIKNNRSIDIKNNRDIQFYLILSGKLRIEFEERNYEYTSGEVCLIPAQLSNYILSIDDKTEIFQISVPR